MKAALNILLTPKYHPGSREDRVVKLDIQLSDQEAERLRALAEQVQLSLPDCARALLVEQLDQPAEEFEHAAARVLERNAELYRRLS